MTFTSSVTDTSTGLQYMNARYYNPSTGRFLTQDSYSGNAYEPWTQHLYSYCGNNPVNMIDPTGHYAGMTYNEYSVIQSGAHKFKPLIDPYIKKVVSNATNPTGKVLEVVDEYTSELWDEVQDDPSATNIVKWATVGGIDLDRMFKQENPLSLDHWVANIQGFLFVYMFYQAGANAVATNTATNAMRMPAGSISGSGGSTNVYNSGLQHGDSYHYSQMKAQVDNLIKNGKHTDIYVNKGLSNVINNPTTNLRPDIMAIRPNGLIDVFEVQSSTQSAPFMQAKMRLLENELGALFGDMSSIIFR